MILRIWEAVRLRGIVALVAAMASGVLLVACASGGLGLEGPEAEALFIRYGGAWVLDEGASDDASRVEVGVAGVSRVVGVERRTGGVPSTRRSASVPGEGIQVTQRLVTERWLEFTLTLDDSTFAFTPAGQGSPLVLPMDGREVGDSEADGSFKASLLWNNREPRIERSVSGGRRIVDEFEFVTEDRLLVTRTIEGQGVVFGVRDDQGGVRVVNALHFFYDRQAAGGR